MATNHVQSQTIPPQPFFESQVFVIHGPTPETQNTWQALLGFVRAHPLATTLGFLAVLFGATYGWAGLEYPGLAFLQTWGCEAAAVILSWLTIFLYLTFRRWERERQIHAVAQRERLAEINALLCTPPPLPVAARLEEEFALTIEYWASAEPLRLTAESLAQAELPDEFLAPDVLVMNFEIRETVSPARQR